MHHVYTKLFPISTFLFGALLCENIYHFQSVRIRVLRMEYMLRISLCVDVHALTIIIYIKNCLVCEIESNCRPYFAARKGFKLGARHSLLARRLEDFRRKARDALLRFKFPCKFFVAGSAGAQNFRVAFARLRLNGRHLVGKIFFGCGALALCVRNGLGVFLRRRRGLSPSPPPSLQTTYQSFSKRGKTIRLS